MAQIRSETPVWYVEGALWYHPLSLCRALENEKARTGRSAESHPARVIVAKRVDICPQCREKFKGIPEDRAHVTEKIVHDVYR